MNIHEYQAKELLAKYGAPVPAGHAALTVEEAVEAAKRLPGPLYVVKAQIHAGGRGKGKFKELGPDVKGGVRLARTLEEVRAAATDMLGNTLVTIQTGPAGKQVNRLYVTDGVDIDKEFYLALLVDRSSGRIALVASTEGGMDIEEVAHSTPEKIHTITVDPATGFMPHHGRRVAAALELSGDLAKQAAKVAGALYKAFLATDASQIEINPLAIAGGQIQVLDAKVGFDGNALFRHPDLMALRDETEEEPMELEASKHDLAYIKLDGDIGCMVNGAGLAMATMDIIKLNGMFPANFLDVGGGATKEKVTAAFKIILSDPAVKGILVNIFGGIMRCDIIAEGGCRCGRLRLRVTGAPLFTAACHCRGCQLMAASAFSLTSCYLAGQFELIAGEPVIGGLHGPARQHFCPHCLSWVFTRPEGMDEIVNLRTTMLDDPPREPPFLETYTSEALPWAKTGATHSFETFPPMDRYQALIAEFAWGASSI